MINKLMTGSSVSRSHQVGFTLLESIVAMIVMGVAMTMLITLFFPHVENSAIPKYQVRASALGQSMMNTILSRGFDENSDSNGSRDRCDEDGANPCTTTLGPDKGEIGTDASFFNDVDDYIGCWYTTEFSESLCTSEPAGSLTTVLGEDMSDEYANFVVNVVVTNQQEAAPHIMRKIEVSVVGGEFDSIDLTAYKGNY